MQSIAELLTTGGTNPSLVKSLSERIEAAEKMTPEERQADLRQWMQHKVDSYNAMQGHLNDGYVNSDKNRVEGDGYNCPLCLNRGNTMFLEERNGMLYERSRECKCMVIRRSIWRMKASGLEKSIRDYTFKRFEVTQQWQQTMLDMAQRYLREGVAEGRWLYFGGQPGCGKTHLCTAVAGKLLYERPLLYVIWPQVSKKLKAIVNEAEDYEREVTKLESIEVLYIDDFFKPVYGEDSYGNRKILPPTTGDIKLAFEILNYRYINKLPTILSSEWGVSELTDMDEATGSRIHERSQGYRMMITRDRSRNYRLSDDTVV